jgi:hypothetical protein
MPYILLLLSTIFLYISLGAGYFDVWWHFAGRVETFFSLPHAILYGSILGYGMIILCVVLFRMRNARSFIPSGVPHHRYLALAGTGALIQLVSGVSDGFYHSIVGFDVTIWSPPHLGAIYGGVLTGLGLAGLWFTSNKNMLHGMIGGTVTLGIAIMAIQFSMAEYAVSSRFLFYPEYYVIFITLMYGLVLTIGVYITKRPIAVLTMAWAFVLELTVWLAWEPIYRGSGAVSYPFPLLAFIGAVWIDLSLLIPRMKNLVSSPSARYLWHLMLLLCFVPSAVLAHEGDFKRAPDLHPLWVMVDIYRCDMDRLSYSRPNHQIWIPKSAEKPRSLI